MVHILSQSNVRLRRTQILNKLNGDQKLPSLPVIVARLEAMINNPQAHSAEIARLIESEPVIAGRVLKLANSAFYGAGRAYLSDMTMAVGRLGYKTIRSLVYSAVLPEIFTGICDFDHTKFWRHSLSVAHIAQALVRRIARDATSEDGDTAYFAGLMHDIGLLVFIRYLPDAYSSIVERGIEKGMSLGEIEHTVFGIDHAELGAIFIERFWEMDSRIIQAVEKHHTHPLDYSPTRHEKMIRATLFMESVYIANLMCIVYGIDNGIGGAPQAHNLDALVKLATLGYEENLVSEMVGLANEAEADLSAIISD